MAINPLSLCEISPACSLSFKSGPSTACRSVRTDYGDHRKVSKRCRKKCKALNSPYMHSGDKIQIVSRVTEKKMVHNKVDGYAASFPVANLYKTTSDEFNSPKAKAKKVKKSVLTLPNERTPVPQTCTVSDLNEAEYDHENNKSPAKRVPLPTRKRRVPKDFVVFNRDATKRFSQTNLDRSSSELLEHFEGDGKRAAKKQRGAKTALGKEEFQPHDVWNVLRDMNRFQFPPSPPISIDSICSSKKTRKCNTRKGTQRLIETCHTEEISYIANFEYETAVSPQSRSRSSSGDRITVIDRSNPNDAGEEQLSLCHDRAKVKKMNGSVERYTKEKEGIKERYNKAATNNPNAKEKKDKRITIRIPKTERPKICDTKRGVSPGDVTDNDLVSVASTHLYSNTHLADGDKLSNKKKRVRGVEGEPRPVKNDQMKTFRRNGSPKDGKSQIPVFLKDTCRSNKFQTETEQRPGTKQEHINKVANRSDREETFCNENIVHTNVQKRRLRLVTTMPSAAAMPRMTVADIKKKISHIRFPFTILGNDQLSSNFEVKDYNPPQFYGLDKHIWPYMAEWTKKPKDKSKLRGVQHNNYKQIMIPNTFKLVRDMKKNLEVNINKPLRDKKLTVTANKKKLEQKPHNFDFIDNTSSYTQNIGSPVKISGKSTNGTDKQKCNTIRHAKDKKIKVIHTPQGNHMLSQLEIDDSKIRIISMAPSTVDIVDTGTDPIIMDPPTKPDYLMKIGSQNDTRNRRSYFPMATWIPSVASHAAVGNPLRKQYWTKGPKENDFIDNVIKKVKSGIYYSQENPRPHMKKKVEFVQKVVRDLDAANRKEASIQTTHPHSSSGDDSDVEEVIGCQELVVLPKACEPAQYIPGFDDTLPGLEIKSFNMNQISVKQCTTDILLQFDVNIIEKPEARSPDIGMDRRCIPLRSPDGHTKMFKYNTTIMNAVLPAQLCTLLPRLIHDQFNTGMSSKTHTPSSDLSLLPFFNDQSSSSISDVSMCEGPVNLIQLPMQMFEYRSPSLKRLLRGRFSGVKSWHVSRKRPKVNASPTINHSLLGSDLKPTVVLQRIICVVNPTTPLSIAKPESNVPCKALQPYTSPSMLMPEPNNFNAMVEKMMRMRYSNFNMLFKLPTYINPIRLRCYNDTITVDMTVESQGVEQSMSITVCNVKLDTLFNGFLKKNFVTKYSTNKSYDLPSRCIECISAYRTGKTVRRSDLIPSIKAKKRRNTKQYKKCKSMSCMAVEKSGSALTSVRSLEDFFQCFGSAKTLASVCGGAVEEKILSAVAQMKSWITEITPRQALLVLLLTNKKDTTNLVRCRALLLQGIAVNRITRSSELDMEIEVIENENLRPVQYGGSSNKPATVEESEGLFEELQWIAKTTASDFNRPFDESSELLLKSLLEKRKKLNPSYLRVMARYVGLGLLKTKQSV